jgi:hypothetical protein
MKVKALRDEMVMVVLQLTFQFPQCSSWIKLADQNSKSEWDDHSFFAD